MRKYQNKGKKTSAKAHGLKTIVKTPSYVAISTYGNKDKPVVVEQSIDRKTNVNTFLVEKLKFDAELFENKTLVLKANKALRGEQDGPIFDFDISSERKDLLDFKDRLENEMFNKNNYKDNIHIQIAYNILDIKKIIALYIGDVLISLRKLTSRADDNADNQKDIVGLLNFETPFENLKEDYVQANEAFIKRLYDYSMYFDNAFINRNGSLSEDYDVLRILSLIRQGVVHGGKYSSYLYNEHISSSTEELFEKSKAIFNNDLKHFNNSFKQKSKLNLMILFEATKDRKVLNRYYEYQLYKHNKNIGISLDIIRDHLIENLFNDIDKIRIKVYRNKILNIYTYLIYQFYVLNADKAEALRDSLRSVKTEYGKRKVYEIEVKKLLKEKKLISRLIKVKQSIWRFIQNGENYKPRYNQKLSFRLEPVSYFPSLLYVLSKFLDQKEVSELLTSVINKLEDIASLETILMTTGDWNNDFNSNYCIFNENNINELINDFKMAYSLASNKRRLTKLEGSRTDINKSIFKDALNMIKKDSFVTDDNVEEYLHIETESESDDSFIKRKTRNFVMNMIAKNRRFVYLIKYINPKDCYKLVTNDNILDFVFKCGGNREYLPEPIIEAYYRNIYGLKAEDDAPDIEEIKNILIDRLKNIDINEIMVNCKKMRELKKQKCLFALYLTIAFIIVKGLIYTNSIYLLAYNAYERDTYYAFGKTDSDGVSFELVDKYICNKKEKTQSIQKQNVAEAGECFNSQKGTYPIYRYYRDKIVHLNFIQTSINYLDKAKHIRSFFDIYNFGVQQWAINETGKGIKQESPYIVKLKSDLDEYGTYQRNFLKILNLPFGYNLARYNNLTIEDLFNDNYVPK